MDDITLSRKLLAIVWRSSDGLGIWRLSDNDSVSVRYRVWGHRDVNLLTGRVVGLSPRLVAQLGTLGFWLRTVPGGASWHPILRTRARSEDPDKTWLQQDLPRLSEFREEFTCRGLWMDARHLLLEPCEEEGHDKARANLAWLVGSSLPYMAWPPGGWTVPEEVQGVTVRSRVRQFDCTNLNPTVAQAKPLKAFLSWSLETHIRTLPQVLQRMLEEQWLPETYLYEASQILQEAVPVDWAAPPKNSKSDDVDKEPAQRVQAIMWELPPNTTELRSGKRIARL